jgi:ATP-binding cassette subfamily F protein 3
MPQVRNILGCFLFTGDDVFKKIGVLSGGERSRVALTCMLLKPANFLILDEPTNHLDMQSQGVLQRALLDYPGSVMIVSHNRDFLDQLVTKTLEFRPGEEPRLFHGNIAYYLDKKAEEKSSGTTPTRKPPATTADAEIGRVVLPKRPSESIPGVNRKDQRRQEALAREAKTKVLQPLEKELETLEAKIAEQEAAQATLTAALSSEEISGDPEKLRQTTNAVEKITKTLELAYTRWSSLTEEIEQVKAKHGL